MRINLVRKVRRLLQPPRSAFLLLGFLIGCQVTLLAVYLVQNIPALSNVYHRCHHNQQDEYQLAHSEMHKVVDPFGEQGETVISQRLESRIRIMCMILTMPSNHRNKSLAVKYTWASRCNEYFFVSSEDDPDLPAYAAVANESRDSLWDKVKFGVHLAVDNWIDKFDFFLKADDDTYIVMENVRMMLNGLDPNEPFITGRRFKKFADQGYASGGSGYVISREGLLRIAEGMKYNEACGLNMHSWAEDVLMGVCAESMGVKFRDSLDHTQRERFHPFWFSLMIDEETLLNDKWFTKFNYHPVRGGSNCCSDYSVSFHYLEPLDMFTYDYLLYYLRPYGLHHDYQDIVKLLRNHSAFT